MDKHDTPNTALLEARRAGREWLTARDHLGPEVRGLDLAPRAYADSVRILLSPAGVGRGGSVVRALLAALPELGHEAAATVERLAANNRLVLATREPCRFLPVWRPLLPDEAEPIARSFETAAEASTRLNTSLEVASRPRPQSLDVQITRRQPSQHLSVVR